MADGVAISAGVGTTIATDEISSAHYQLVKLAFGALNSATLVSSADGLPVNVLNASVAVTAAALPLPSGAATAANQATEITHLAALAGAVAGGAVVVADGGGALTVDGTVGVTGTVAVSGPLTDTQLRASAVPVSLASVPSHAVTNAGTFAVQAAQSGSWTVTANAGSGTLAVSAVSLPLPTGAATESTLSTLNGKVTACNTGAVTVSAALPAGTNLLGRVSASVETSTAYDGTTALTPKFAAIAASSSGDNTVVAAVTSKKIRVLRWDLAANGNVNAKWKSGASTDKTGLYYLTQYAGVGGSYCPVGLFETAAGEALVLNLSGAVAVGGVLTYVEV
jgi:hypothetical protein